VPAPHRLPARTATVVGLSYVPDPAALPCLGDGPGQSIFVPGGLLTGYP
jgi:hypothetical protein